MRIRVLEQKPWNNLEGGEGWEGGGSEAQGEGTFVYLWLIHTGVWQKPKQCCKAIILQINSIQFSSVQFSCSVVSDFLWLHGLQHPRPPCPSPTPWVYSNSCPLSWWYLPTISSSVIPFSSHLQSFPASGKDLFQWVSSSHQVAKVLEFQLQHQSFQWIFSTDFL